MMNGTEQNRKRCRAIVSDTQKTCFIHFKRILTFEIQRSKNCERFSEEKGSTF